MSSISCSIDEMNDDIEAISINSKNLAKNDDSNRLTYVIKDLKNQTI